MKKIYLTLIAMLLVADFSYAQNINYSTETFTYDGNTVYHYGLGWYTDPDASAYGPMAYLSAYGGIKFFTQGGFKAVLDVHGYLGLGTNTPLTPLDVKLATNEHVQFVSNVNGAYTGASGIVCINDANTAYTPLGFYASNFYFGNGNVLIGKTSQINTAYILDVNGNVRANEVVVNTSGADFVFNPSYRLSSLSSLKKYIDRNHHLPEIASAKQMQVDGLNVGDNQIKLLQKVEELTLYLIEKDKKDNEQSAQLKSQQDQINLLIKQVAELSKKK